MPVTSSRNWLFHPSSVSCFTGIASQSISSGFAYIAAPATRCYGTSKTRQSAETSHESNTLSSSRGRAAVGLLPSYLSDARAVPRYSATTYPKGALQLGVAESQMLEDWLLPALNKHPVLSADAIYYQPTSGREDLKLAMAAYVEDLCNLDSGRINQEGLILGAGCNAVLENLCMTLADAGNGVLIPTPYYAAFEFDLAARAGLTIHPVTTQKYHNKQNTDSLSRNNQLDPTIYYPTTASLDAAYERTTMQGTQPKILLISHPMNPLGICYPVDTVMECIEWCRKRKVHLISDEIYAGSVYNGGGKLFASVLKLAGEELGPYVHWVYALSKDFALSGLRVGVAYTENPEIIVPMQKLNDLCQISSETQVWTAKTLSRKLDDNNCESELWTTAFRRENHRRLRNRSLALTEILDEYKVPYLSPQAGLFLWIDLSQFLDTTGECPASRELALYRELINFGLLLTPGNSMRNELPGFFRCVFTAASDDEFAVALQRIEKFCQTKQPTIK